MIPAAGAPRADAYLTVARMVFPIGQNAAEAAPLYLAEVSPGAGPAKADRYSVTVPAGGSVSLGTYFNAFPATYWRRWTSVAGIRLQLRASGGGEVRLVASDASGVARVLRRHDVAIDDEEVSFDIDLAAFDEGGACWLELEAAVDSPLRVSDGRWLAARPPTWQMGRATVGITTMDRVDYCIAQLSALASDPDLDDILETVVVVDQGRSAVTDDSRFGTVQAALGSRLRMLRQPNLGGSGGFARAMVEALERSAGEYVLLLDDDARSEPQSIFRAVRFADFAGGKVVVGGGMLHLEAPTVLYTQGEEWDRRTGWVRLGREDLYDHDFAAEPFPSATGFHRLRRVDFNGWWMCLIPLTLLRTAGLALPLFLKGDDLEFGLRARAFGYETVSLPGVAVWHLGWDSKAPIRTWQAYFMQRNRLVTALLHSPYRRGGLVVVASFLGDLRLLAMLQYSAVQLRAEAMLDAALGPERLPEMLATRLSEVQLSWSSFSEAGPGPAEAAQPQTAPPAIPPKGVLARAGSWAAIAARHLLLTPGQGRHTRAHIPADGLGWWTFATVDSALVDAADGSGPSLYQRDLRRTRRYLRRSIRLHLRLWRSWPSLARRYRAGAGRIASVESWRRLFAEVTPGS